MAPNQVAIAIEEIKLTLLFHKSIKDETFSELAEAAAAAISVEIDPPSLVVPFLPSLENDHRAIMDAAMMPIAILSIYIEANVIHHSYCMVAVAQILLCP